MTGQSRPDLQSKAIDDLKKFQARFAKYTELIETDDYDAFSDLLRLRGKLELESERISSLFIQILGEANQTVEGATINRRNLIANTLVHEPTTVGVVDMIRARARAIDSLLNRAIGKVKDDLWPQAVSEPILEISDHELTSICIPILASDGRADTVIREATTILENRIRNKPSHEYLSKLIPDSSRQSGQRLVDALFAPKSPVVVVSTDERERAGVFAFLKGIFAYPRNSTHHQFSESLETSWAWSVVGMIDHMLGLIGKAMVTGDQTSDTSGDVSKT